MPKEYNGPDRRMNQDDHDKICDRRTGWIKSILFLILGSVVLGGGYSYSQNEGIKSVNSTQTQRIEHTEKTVEKLEEKFDSHMYEQRTVNSMILDKLNELGKAVVRIEEKVE